MRKILLVCLVILLLAITFKPPIDITGFFVKATSTIITIARAVVKEVLSLFIKVL